MTDKQAEEINDLLDKIESLECDIHGWNEELGEVATAHETEDLEAKIDNAEAEIENIRLDLDALGYKGK